MTSNRPVDEWGKLLGDVPARGAILHRLLHRAELIAIHGRSHRLDEGLAGKAEERTGKAGSGTGKTGGSARKRCLLDGQPE